jgi:hypothetical protein
MCFECEKKNEFVKKTNFDLVSIREDKRPLYIKKNNIKCDRHQCCGYDTKFNKINKEYDYTRCTNNVKDDYVCENHSIFSFNIVNSEYTDIQLNRLTEIDYKRNKYRNFPVYYTMIYTFFFNKGYYNIRAKDDIGKKIFFGVKYFDINGDNLFDNIYYIHHWEQYHRVIVSSEIVYLTLKNILRFKLEKKLPHYAVNEILNGDIFTNQLVKLMEAKIYLFKSIFEKNDLLYKYNYLLSLIKKFLNDYKSINNSKVHKLYLCMINKINEFEKIITEQYKTQLTEEQTIISNKLTEELHKLTNFESIEEFKIN